jgi:GNAT superfamily N-acetyltransferase
MDKNDIPRDLGDGLVLRRATAEDTERLAAFSANVLADPGQEEPSEPIAIWTRDLMARPHPTFGAGGFTLVEDTRTNTIVSTLCLIPQTWSYGGIEFGVGRTELVGTHPDYRRRGLIRAQFEMIHGWSARLGHQVQAITGIPYFYRQFGYEMGLALGGRRWGYMSGVPKLKDGESDPYRVRRAKEADVPFIVQVYDGGMRRYLVGCTRDEALWRYELGGRTEKSFAEVRTCVVETAGGEPVGFLIHPPTLWQKGVALWVYELKPGVSWLAVTPSVLRYMRATGEAYASDASRETGKEKTCERCWLGLGSGHPAYDVVDDWLPNKNEPYAWYVRVPDLPGFLRHVAPVLEQRLAESPLVGYAAELKIGFYRDGLRLAFEGGRLAAAEPWQSTPADRSSAEFPDLTFLQLLFGYRTFEELDYAFADCWAKNAEVKALLNVLFPKLPSCVWGVV